jgi:hypothetical protein
MPASDARRFWFLAAALLVSPSPAWADFRMEKHLPLAPGGAFTLETEAGAVTVVGDSTADVFLLVTSERDDLVRRMDFQFDVQTGAVRVKATRRSHLVSDWLRSWGWTDRLRFEVHVPRRTGVAVQTAGGSVRVTDLVGGARVRTSGGALRLQNIAGDVEARTSGGGIHVSQAGGRVEARTSGGPIVVRFAPGNSHGGALHTSGGSVQAAIDSSAALSIDAVSSGGGVSSDLDIPRQGGPGRYALRGDLNGGGPVLTMRTSGGLVRISSLER